MSLWWHQTCFALVKKRVDRLVRRPSFLGCSLYSVVEVGDRRTITKLSHLHDGLTAPSATDCFTQAVYRRTAPPSCLLLSTRTLTQPPNPELALLLSTLNPDPTP